MKIIETEALSFTYQSGVKVFENVEISANEGELVLVCGATACGKTTFLRCMKPSLAPRGTLDGNLKFCEKSISALSEREEASEIGFVMQRPENQTVTDRVRSELAFCGENLGLPPNVIRRQIAETSAYFGISHLLDRPVDTLSGGQRQLVNLAAVMAVKPKLVVLDEPTAQLDPTAASDFIRTLHRITRELSVTVLIAEHRFEELLPIADKVLYFGENASYSFGTPRETAHFLANSAHMRHSLPAGLRVYHEFHELSGIAPPLTLAESRRLIRDNFTVKNKIYNHTKRQLPNETAVRMKNVFFTYDSRKEDVIRGAELSVNKGEICAILGENGCGKSTLVSLISGVLMPYRGKVEIFDKSLRKYPRDELYGKTLAVLPQDVRSTFMHDTVRDELADCKTEEIADFTPFLDMHPYDLSGGQQQLLGLKKLVNRPPRILILDEPTKGLDGYWRQRVSDELRKLRNNGTTLIIVTHDMELAAMTADRCVIIFDGTAAAEGAPHEIFADSLFFTTSAEKTARGCFSGISATSELIEMCRRNGVK